MYFAENDAKSVKLIHRSENFRAHNDSVQKALNYASSGKIKMLLNAEVKEIVGEKDLEKLIIKFKNGEDDLTLNCDNWLPLFGLTPKLGPIANWGLEIEKNAIKVNNAKDYSTNIEGHGGLLVHGPLQATLMLNLACSVAGKLPEKMTYRGVSPLVCGDPIMIDADSENGNLVASVRSADGNDTMKATVTL